MEPDHRSRLKHWLASGQARLHPASFPQRELWETSPVDVADPANHICAFLEIRGELTHAEGTVAMQRVVDRHEVMRLSFLPGKEGPIQLVRASMPVSLSFRELTPAQARPEAMEEAMAEIYHQPFDIVQGPLHRIEMMRRTPSDHVLAMAIHHAIADGWSLGIFVQDLAAAYLLGLADRRHPSTPSAGLPPVPMTHGEWVAAERAHWQPAELARRAEFWRAQLAGSRRIWADRDGTVRGPGPLQRRVGALPAGPTRAIKELANRQRTTLFSTLLAAFQISLWKWAGRDDIVVGSPVANRHKEAVRQTMGYFAGVVPMRGRVEADRPFASHLQATQATTVDSFAHAMPFAELARALGESGGPDRHSVFDVRFALQNHPVPDTQMTRFGTRLHMRSTGTARFDLGCEITEMKDELEVVWLHRPSIVSEADVIDLDRLFRAVVAQVCQHPDTRSAAVIP